MSKLRVMELCCSPHKGGLELYFADICNQLASSFDVLAVVSPSSPLASRIAVPKQTLAKWSHYTPLISAWRLAKQLDKHGTQVLHIHWGRDLTVAVLAKLLSKTKPKLVMTRHMKFPAMKNNILHRFLYRHVDMMMAITQTMANDLHRFIPEDVRPEIRVNYLGVRPIENQAEAAAQLRLQYNPENKHFVIGLFGRIDYDKGHEFLLDAMRMAKAKGLPFRALIVGHPMQESYLEALKQKVRDAGLAQDMLFLGFVENPLALMQACDVVVLATIEETFGLVLIEAMSVGTPVIGSNRGGVPEIIEDKQTGLLFESCDSESLFQALVYMYEHPKQAAHFASRAQAKVKQTFDATDHVRRLVAALEEVAHD